MHDDYKSRLTVLSDKLTDTVLTEADPDNWPGAGKTIDQHTTQERGDRYWFKKNAAATLTLLTKVHTLIGLHTRGGKPGESNPDDEAFSLGQQVAKAEREAAAIIERIQKGK
ncbi:hypothetical protein H2Y57_05255 [Pectobacterium aroidearum]|uniref:Uncharacterized protein n=1 Tax=Pectobacterium aroidearum TaxID=1201031 RepID=A0AAW3STY2_9GAMM|nr:hypothetical protein [Pectobacterium aroidearum]MBA5203094.1 hypothetical protein [Pectobacterium aroidearum]